MRRHVTYANVTATLALAIAVTGGAYAAVKLPANSVGARELKAASVGPSELRAGAVATKHLRRGSVGVRQLNPRMLQQLAKSTVVVTAPAPGSVTAEHLAPNSVGPDAIQGNAVGSDQLAPASVGSRELKVGGILFENIQNGEVSPRLFAHSSSSGTLGANSGGVSVTRESKGIYLFSFPRNLRSCVPVSNVGFGSGPGVIGAGATTTASLVGDSQVRVTVYRKGFTFNDVEDNDVNLIVVC